MKSLLMKAALVLAAFAIYVSAPFVTAWSIREAVRNGNSAYLARAIDWDSVRTTLKPTLSRIALDLPDPALAAFQKPTLWQRFKAYWGQGAVSTAVDSYLTPEGLPQLFQMRKAYRTYISGFDEDANRPPLLERIKRTWTRVKRAEFTSLTTFEVDMLDKHDDTRLYLGKLELTTTGWKLTELRIKMLTTASDTPLEAEEPEVTPKAGIGRFGMHLVTPATAATPAKATVSTPATPPSTAGFVSFKGDYGDGHVRTIKVPAGRAQAYWTEMEESGKADALQRITSE